MARNRQYQRGEQPKWQRIKVTNAPPVTLQLPVSNGRSGRLKPWPEFLRSLSAAKLIQPCHNNQLRDGHLQLLMKMKNGKKRKKAISKIKRRGAKCVLSERTGSLQETEKKPP